jgi:GNAT superfamily N-acetyltransferase
MEYVALSRSEHEPESQPALKIRPIAFGDADSYRSILERTSEEDRYCRFFHVVNHFDLSDIRRFVEPRLDTIGLIAEEDGVPYGVAHAFFLSDHSAEIAIVVAGDVRRHGVGHALLERLLGELRSRQFTEVIAMALSVNSSFAHLAASVGMTPSGPLDGMTTWTLSVPVEA